MSKSVEVLKSKISNRKAYIGIVGMGYVGIPLMISFIRAGYNVVGFDIDSEKVQKLNRGENYIKHIGDDYIKIARKSQMFEATSDYSQISMMDVIVLCLPTPLNRYREPDMSYIVTTIDSILDYLHKDQIISLESTTYPGTTDEILTARIKTKGFNVGQDIFVIYSPEREDPGNKEYRTGNTPKIVGGTTNNCLELGLMLYGSIVNKVIPVSSTRTAELTKLLENIYRAVNIGLVNEMKIIADSMNIDIYEVIDAAATKPFGFTPFYPGPGWGGHCIPIDPFYLTWKAREYGLQTKFIELAGEINTAMPEWVLSKVIDVLNNNGKALNGANLLILGLAYKKNIDDIRESPAVKFIELLRKKGAIIHYSDPYLPEFPRMREHSFDLKSLDITPEVLQSMDCVVLITDHDVFNYDMILKYSKIIVDTRGRYRLTSPKIVSC